MFKLKCQDKNGLHRLQTRIFVKFVIKKIVYEIIKKTPFFLQYSQNNNSQS